MSSYLEQGPQWRSVAIRRNFVQAEIILSMEPNLNIRWMRGAFVGKLDSTDEFLLLTLRGAMKTRCVRRLEGANAWNFEFFNLCVGSPWNATTRSTQQTPTIQ